MNSRVTYPFFIANKFLNSFKTIRMFSVFFYVFEFFFPIFEKLTKLYEFRNEIIYRN